MGFKYKLLSILICALFLNGKAQDIHFSQYNGSLLNLNPAFTGLFDGDYRVNGIYRSQWQSVPVPYRTVSFAGDMRYKPKQLFSDCFGIGILFNNDKAGDAFYTNNQFYINLSYIHKLKRDSSLLISIGLNTGLNAANFNYNEMTFDSQFDGYAYNSSLGTGENFQKTKT
ncbi:MAG TPA: PorP/SprF family type IX secretion system membrane protein, partial [Bacteroidia bacterium]|nr:PorP/SprF family type IX secretion system membrane protein [Bacteroidia bacterium]